MPNRKSKRKTVSKRKVNRCDKSLPFVELADSDVLLGRGSGISRHPGNQRFRLLILKYREMYSSCPRHEKSRTAKKVVEELGLLKPPGRFVEVADKSGRFVQVNQTRAIEKTAQALRERKWTMVDHDSYCQAMDVISANLPRMETNVENLDDLKSQLKSAPAPSLRIKIASKNLNEKTRARLAMSAVNRRNKVKRSLSLKRKKTTKEKHTKETIPTQAVSPTVPQVTPPSTPTIEEESGEKMFAGFSSWLPVKRRLPYNEESCTYCPDTSQYDLQVPVASHASSQDYDALVGELPFLEDNDTDSILPHHDDFFVPLEMVRFSRNLSACREAIIPDDDESVVPDGDVEPLPFDFIFDGSSEAEVSLSTAFHHCITQGLLG